MTQTAELQHDCRWLRGQTDGLRRALNLAEAAYTKEQIIAALKDALSQRDGLTHDK